jgi:hypothetical protein
MAPHPDRVGSGAARRPGSCRQRRSAGEATTHVATTDDSVSMPDSAAYQGRVAMLAGDSRATEEHFLAADQILYANGPGN